MWTAREKQWPVLKDAIEATSVAKNRDQPRKSPSTRIGGRVAASME
jgi:hypothetical protein